MQFDELDPLLWRLKTFWVNIKKTRNAHKIDYMSTLQPKKFCWINWITLCILLYDCLAIFSMTYFINFHCPPIDAVDSVCQSSQIIYVTRPMRELASSGAVTISICVTCPTGIKVLSWRRCRLQGRQTQLNSIVGDLLKLFHPTKAFPGQEATLLHQRQQLFHSKYFELGNFSLFRIGDTEKYGSITKFAFKMKVKRTLSRD